MKKGFTLVELLVVIAVIAGISVVAVTSLIGIADNRKEESWENVKMTIESAAKTYYKNNGYLFENVDNAYAWITVGKLVNEGYLNVVKNPKTGKEVSYCNRVLIKIVNGTATYKYEDKDNDTNNRDCDYAAILDSIEIRTINGPQASVLFRRNLESDKTAVTRNDGGWFNIEKLGGENKSVQLCVKPKIPEKKSKDGYVASVIIGGNNKFKGSDANSDGEYCASYSDGTYLNNNGISLYLEDEDGGYWQKSISFGVDTKKPVCKVNKSGTLGTNDWYTSNINIFAVDYNSNVISGIDDSKTRVATSENGLATSNNSSGTQSADTTGAIWYGSITSKAGNKSDPCVTTLKKDTVTPTCKVNSSGTDVLNNGWYSSNVTITTSATNSPISGTASSQVSTNRTSGFIDTGTQSTDTNGTYWYGRITSGAGLTGNCGTYVKRDTEAPTITNVSIKSNNSKYNTANAKGYFSISDSRSGIDKVTSNYPNDSGNSTWYKNGANVWNINGYGIELGALDGGTHKLKITATDLAGNLNSVTSGKYTTYEECSETNPSDSYGSYGKCSKYCGGGNKNRTKTTTNSDKYTRKTCSTDTTDDSKTCNTRSCTTTAKAYKWDYASRDCSGSGSVNFTTAATPACTSGTTNCTRTGPYRMYEFVELEIDCSMNANTGEVTATKCDDVTAETHKYLSGGKRHSYIFYYNNNNGKTACDTDGAGSGKYVYQVCQHNSDINAFHGVNWSSGNTSNNWTGQGWYNNSYTSKIDKSKTKAQACKWACEQKY